MLPPGTRQAGLSEDAGYFLCGDRCQALCLLLLLHYFLYPSVPTYEVDNVISPIVWMRKLRCWECQFPPCHQLVSGRGWVQTQALCP